MNTVDDGLVVRDKTRTYQVTHLERQDISDSRQRCEQTQRRRQGERDKPDLHSRPVITLCLEPFQNIPTPQACRDRGGVQVHPFFAFAEFMGCTGCDLAQMCSKPDYSHIAVESTSKSFEHLFSFSNRDCDIDDWTFDWEG